MNYMEQVAKMLGVEIGECFEINKQDGVFILCYDGLLHTQSGFMCNELLSMLLYGKHTIKRKPWRPQDGECYYRVDEIGYVYRDRWDSSCLSDHMNYYKIGNCYKTSEEAKVNRDKWLAFYKSDEVLEV